MYLVYEIIDGVGSNHKLFKSQENATNHFKALIKEDAPDLAEEDVAFHLDESYYDNQCGYEVVAYDIEEQE